MGGFQWGGTLVRGTARVTRVFEQNAEQRLEHGGLWWIAADGTKYPIKRIAYTESKGPEFFVDHANKIEPEE